VLSLAVYLRIIVPLYQPSGTRWASARSVAIVWAIALVLTVAVGLGAQALVARIV